MPPRATEPQSLNRLLIRFKQQIAAFAGRPTAKALQDCETAAAALEECLAVLETGPTALQLALNQVSG
jgi:hypothetical protein